MSICHKSFLKCQWEGLKNRRESCVIGVIHSEQAWFEYFEGYVGLCSEVKARRRARSRGLNLRLLAPRSNFENYGALLITDAAPSIRSPSCPQMYRFQHFFSERRHRREVDSDEMRILRVSKAWSSPSMVCWSDLIGQKGTRSFDLDFPREILRGRQLENLRHSIRSPPGESMRWWDSNPKGDT